MEKLLDYIGEFILELEELDELAQDHMGISADNIHPHDIANIKNAIKLLRFIKSQYIKNGDKVSQETLKVMEHFKSYLNEYGTDSVKEMIEVSIKTTGSEFLNEMIDLDKVDWDYIKRKINH